MVDVLEISVGVDDHHFIRGKGYGDAINEGVNDDLVSHVLALVDQCAVGFADLEDLLGVVPDDVEVTVDLLLILDLEVETAAKESDVHFLLVLHCLITKAIAEFFELYRNLWDLLWRIFLNNAGDRYTVTINLLPYDFLQLRRRFYTKSPYLTFLIQILTLRLSEGLVKIPSIGDESRIMFA